MVQDTTTNTQTTDSNTNNVTASSKYNAIVSDVKNNNQIVLSMDEDEESLDSVSDEVNFPHLFSPENYSISCDLESLLYYGYRNQPLRKFKWPNDNILGIYVVAFTVIKNKGKNVLVYNSIYYDSLFKETLKPFLLYKKGLHETFYNAFNNNNLYILDPLMGDESFTCHGEILKNYLIKDYETITNEGIELNST